jgi:hypothetical protein
MRESSAKPDLSTKGGNRNVLSAAPAEVDCRSLPACNYLTSLPDRERRSAPRLLDQDLGADGAVVGSKPTNCFSISSFSGIVAPERMVPVMYFKQSCRWFVLSKINSDRFLLSNWRAVSSTLFARQSSQMSWGSRKGADQAPACRSDCGTQ